MPKPSKKNRNDPSEALRLRRQLVLGFTIALCCAAIAGGMSWWDSLHSVPAEDFVRVYRVHGCRCAFTWAHTLEENGFTVRIVELETLRDIRRQLATPKELQGCHKGQYLTYFIEGHVAPKALRKLAAEQSGARGIATVPVVDSERAENPLLQEKSELIF